MLSGRDPEACGPLGSAASYGARVMIAEEYRVGGTCVIRGCVPKKLLVYASQFSGEFEDAAGYGWTVGRREFHWPALIANKDREIARLEAAYMTTLERFNVGVLKSPRHTRRYSHGAVGNRMPACGPNMILISTGACAAHGAKNPRPRTRDLVQ